jgi:hypothetical protein
LDTHYGIIEKKSAWISLICSDPAHDRRQMYDQIRSRFSKKPGDGITVAQIVLL